MITNKDIRVENGFLIINGDKFPLDGQSPETIMEIVEDNSDTTPTENSTAPITSGGVFTALGTKQGTLTFDSTPTAESANPVTSAGIKTYVDTAIDGTTYKAGDTITAENVVSAAIGSNTSDCYFSVPISKPVAASAVAVSDVSCNLYYGTNQMEAVTKGAYTATIEKGSLLVKLTKANTFSQYGRYIVDFTGTFTFS